MHRTVNLKISGLKNPLGIDPDQLFFSWQMETTAFDARQTAYRIRVNNSQDGEVWNSGFVESDVCTAVEYAGPSLKNCCRYEVEVLTKDASGNPGECAVGFFETGWGDRKWHGVWIKGINGENGNPVLYDSTLPPVTYFRREFTMKQKVVKARLYITALGIFDCQINGKMVSDACFAPGWTDYFHRVQVCTYDVTSLIAEGSNAIAVRLASGWFSGRISNNWNGNKPTYGDTPKLRAMLVCETAANETVIIPTDDCWQFSNAGPIRNSDIYDGEAYDARFNPGDFALPGYMAAGWQLAIVTGAAVKLESGYPQPVRRIEKISPVSIRECKNNVIIVDFGQNITGRESLVLSPARGAVVRIRHGEMLTAEGNLYTGNLRSAKAATVFVGDGTTHQYEPSFTFFGFRYLEITGDVKSVDFDNLYAVVLHTDMERTGYFKCSSAMLNQLYSNIIWGQRGNYLDIPTDCPQRDEKLGWTADAQVFANVASYNYNIENFFAKYLKDLALCRNEFGEFPPYAPYPYSRDCYDGQFGVAGWEDAAYICTWEMYRKYGNRKALALYFDILAETLRRKVSQYPGLICDQALFGDWLNIKAPLPPEYVGTAFMAHAADLLAKMSAVLKRKKEEMEFANLFAAICQTFCRTFLDRDGHLLDSWHGVKRSIDMGDSANVPLQCRTQTGAVLALGFHLVDSNAEAVILDDLKQDIAAQGNHLSTGFLGTPYLVQTLAKYGCIKEAYALLEQETFPSWLYSVKEGATTLWERWDSYSKDGGFGKVEMNSFNHYAYGAIGDFFYEGICGITPLEPGFQHFIIKPLPGGSLTSASAEYHSCRGRICSSWKIENGTFSLEVTVPPNTVCKTVMPDHTVYENGSGVYYYECKWNG